MTVPDIARYLDFANHHGNATKKDIENLCTAVLTHGFHGAFVNPTHVPFAKKILSGKSVVGTAIAFPLGQERQDIKIASAIAAVEDGADELDIVPNTANLLEDPTGKTYLAEMVAIVRAIRAADATVIIKFILETGYMTSDHIRTGAKMIQDSGADYVKFATGMGPKGATLEDLAIVKDVVGPDMKIKVAGGIDTYEEAAGFIEAGVTRIGTSKAVEIVTQSPTSSRPQNTE